jgi:hypothetical protein
MPKDFMTDELKDAASESGPIRPTNTPVSSGNSENSSAESDASTPTSENFGIR